LRRLSHQKTVKNTYNGYCLLSCFSWRQFRVGQSELSTNLNSTISFFEISSLNSKIGLGEVETRVQLIDAGRLCIIAGNAAEVHAHVQSFTGARKEDCAREENAVAACSRLRTRCPPVPPDSATARPRPPTSVVVFPGS